MLPEAVKTLLRVVDSGDFGLVLLNPSLTKTSWRKAIVPIQSSAPAVIYQTVEELFLDFGFVTSTTTFPCLFFKTAPLKAFHTRHDMPSRSKVYSHTFTIFGALRTHKALFLSRPLVTFTLNDPVEEHAKLMRQSPHGIMFYHQSLGLARLISYCAAVTGVPLSRIGQAFEDEVNKDTLKVRPMLLSHFLVHFCLEQLAREQMNISKSEGEFGYLARTELDEITALVESFHDAKLTDLYRLALSVFKVGEAEQRREIGVLRDLQYAVTRHAREKYEIIAGGLRVDGPRKLFRPRDFEVPLRGKTATGRYGIS
jgi:hypothetical protein